MNITKKVKDILDRYPDTDEFVQRVRRARGKVIPKWRDWCFIPLKYWQMLPEKEQPGITDPEKIYMEAATLAGCCTWWYTKGIYRIEENFMQALISTQIPADIPSEVFVRLPQWCVYAELPPSVGSVSPDRHAYGFFAFLDERKSEQKVLHMLIDGGDDQLMPLDFPLDGLLRESMEGFIAYEIERAHKIAKLPGKEHVGTAIDETVRLLRVFIAILLWLCSSDTPEETEDGPANPKPVREKGGFRLYAPEKTEVWELSSPCDLSAGAGWWDGNWEKNDKRQPRYRYRWTNQEV